MSFSSTAHFTMMKMPKTNIYKHIVFVKSGWFDFAVLFV